MPGVTASVYKLSRSPGGPQSPSGNSGEDKNLSLLPEYEQILLGCSAGSEVTVSTALSRVSGRPKRMKSHARPLARK